MWHCMIDLETLSTDQNALVLSVSQLYFKLNTEFVQLSESPNEYNFWQFFERCRHKTFTLDINDQKGRNVSDSTLRWWMGQSENARNKIAKAGVITPVGAALAHLDQTYAELSPTGLNKDGAIVWGNGADFDIGILSSLYQSQGLSVPWAFTKVRCFRTIKNVFKVDFMPFVGEKHNPLHDAANQAYHLARIVNTFPKVLGYANDGVASL